MRNYIELTRGLLKEKPFVQLIEIDRKGLIFFAWSLVLSGFLVFLTDLIFALALQRFLVSVGLLQDLGHTRFFGSIREPYSEGALLILVLTFRLIAISLNNILAGYGFARFEKRARAAIGHTTFLKPTFDVGKASHIFNEIANGCSNFVASSYLFLSRITIAIFLFGSLFIYSWQLTLGIALISVLIIPIQRLIGSSISRISRETLQLLEHMTRQLLVAVRNFLFLSITKISDSEEKKIIANLESIETARRRFYWLSSLRSAVPQFVGVLLLVAIAATPLSLRLDNKSEIVPFLYLLLRFFNSLGDISRTTSHLRLDYPRTLELVSWLRTSRTSSFMRRQRMPMPISIAPSFSVKEVKYSWGEGEKTISYPNFFIPSGAVTLVKGSTGSGKSTFFMLITGVVSPLSGEINLLVGDESKSLTGSRETQVNVGGFEIPTAYVGPDPFLISGSIRKNLRYGLVQDIEDIVMVKALATAGLVEDINSLEVLDQQITEMGQGLSTGQRQKLAWARAIVSQPKLLLLDEATSNLDSRSKEKVLNWVKVNSGKFTTIMVDHNYELDDLVGCTIVLD